MTTKTTKTTNGRSGLRVFVVSAFIALTSVATLPAQSPAPDPAKRAAERIRALQREADDLLAREKTLLVELRKLEIDRQLKSEEVSKFEREAAETERKLAVTTKRHAALRQNADEQRPDVEARLVQLYKLGSGGYWRLMLDVDDLRSMGRAYRTASAMTSLDKLRVLQHQQTLDALAAERTTLQARQRELNGL